MLTGRNLVAGDWAQGGAAYRAFAPLQDEEIDPPFSDGTVELVDRAARAAEAAFADYAARPAPERAAFLRAIGAAIEARAADLTARAHAETGLPEARLNGERGRTIGQLGLFADLIEAGAHLEPRADAALPDRQPLPRPDLRLTHVPLGPVAVFGASNFPLAFSTAGGDTASALAAGCPVVFKGHPAHPGTSELVAAAILEAARACGMPDGVFSLVHGRDHTIGAALVEHPLITAVGFTGSLRGGRALFDLAARRPEPIPFFGELGSVNPVFLLPAALEARGEAIAEAWVGSLTLGAGQFCTNPGVIVGVAGPALERFQEKAEGLLAAAPEQTTLTPGIAAAYRESLAAVHGLEADDGGARCAVRAGIRTISAEDWRRRDAMREEIFGPFGLIVRCADLTEMRDLAQGLDGQLTATLQMDAGDLDTARALAATLARKAGRLIRNGFPTGVEVCSAMMHGGPYPASTDARTTSVGSLAIRRFLRPLAFQDFPAELLPAELQDG